MRRPWAFTAFVFLASLTLLAAQVTFLMGQCEAPPVPLVVGSSNATGFGSVSVPAIGYACGVHEPCIVLGWDTCTADGTPVALPTPPGVAIGYGALVEPGEICIHVGEDRYMRLRLSTQAHEEFRRAVLADAERLEAERRAIVKARWEGDK